LLLAIRRVDNTPGDDILSRRATDQLKGIAIIFLLVGHISLKCIMGEQLTENAGAWAVLIFIVLSGATLVKVYGINNISSNFILKRIRRLLFPLWISLIIFYILDYVILNRTYPVLDMLIHFAGLSANVPPLHTEWFITYMLFLYTNYYVIAKARAIPLIYVTILIGVLYATSYLIMRTDSLKSLQIWLAYTIVFPLGVLIGSYRGKIYSVLSVWLREQKIIFIISMAILFVGYEYITNISASSPVLLKALLNATKNILFIISIFMLATILATARYESVFLKILGKYSFEIFLLHYPFIVSYNIFLYDLSLTGLFVIYLIALVALSAALQRISNVLNRTLLPA